MVGFIFSIIFLILGIVCFVVFNTKTEVREFYVTDEEGKYVKNNYGERVTEEKTVYPLRKYAWTVIVGTLFLMLVVGIWPWFASVGTGKTGVVTTFGKLEDYTLDSGFHTKTPWNKVTEIDTTVNELKFSTPSYTSDSQTVELEITVQYRISTTDTFNVVKDNGIKDTQKNLQDKLENRITSAIKTIVSTKNANDLLINRSSLVVDLAQKIDDFKDEYYIVVSSVNITNIDFTDEYEAAVAAKVAQQQAYEKALIEQQQALAAAENEKKISETKANAAAEVAKIQAEADLAVQQINADAAEYTGKKESAVVLNRLAGINGWTVVLDTDTGLYKLMKSDGTEVTEAERAVGVEKLIEYYYTQTWDGKLPETYVGDDNVSSILIGNN